MVITLAEITITEFDIAESVGDGGVNARDDMHSVKKLLNGIDIKDGGTDGTLDPDDASVTDDEFRRMCEQIRIFQDKNLHGRFTPDGVVEPFKSTLAKLKEVFFLRKAKQPLPGPLSVMPPGGVSGDTDTSGFSAARLARTVKGKDWTLRNGFQQLSQMVPTDGERTLTVSGPGNIASVKILGSNAEIVRSDKKSVTVKGKSSGADTLVIAVDRLRLPVTVSLVVRRPISLKVDAIHLGPETVAGATNDFLTRLLPIISNIFAPQTNIRFASAGAPFIALDGASAGARFTFVPGKDIILLGKSESLTVSVDAHIMRDSDLALLVRDPDAVTVFMSQNMRDTDPDVNGRGRLGLRRCWFKLNTVGKVELPTTAAHEIGHSLGLRHIDVGSNEAYLMQPHRNSQKNRIPSETIEDLIVS